VDAEDLRRKLVEFRLWYSHARPHQHLRGRTPAEAWHGRAKATGFMERWCAWDGRLVLLGMGGWSAGIAWDRSAGLCYRRCIGQVTVQG
jgi:hypothetical protein